MRSFARTFRIGLAVALVIGVPRSAWGSDAHGHADAPAAAPSKAPVSPAAKHAEGVSAEDALKRLADGNARFVANDMKRPNQDEARRCETFSGGQHPFAAVLACADSRVPVEMIFDAGIGDLFVVRVAGNVADVDEVGTLEYGVEHLGINAIVVLGHGKCGAVTAVVEHAHVTKNIEQLVDNIAPAADQARKAFPHLSGQQLVKKAIEMNVQQAAAEMSARSELLRERIASGKLKVVGGVYNLHTGEVDWLDASASPIVVKVKTEMKAEKPQDLHAPAKADSHAGDDGKAADHGHKDAHKAKDDHATDHASTSHEQHSAVPKKKDNWIYLGGMLGGAAGVSYGIIHFMKGKTHVASEETVAKVEEKPAEKPAEEKKA